LISNSRFRLNSGNEIPRLGLGVYHLPASETTMRLVDYALKIGYRHIDTVKLYGNEADIGRAVMESEIQREDIFITTKV
jgi:methylglyoxal/glyoxal reductase